MMNKLVENQIDFSMEKVMSRRTRRGILKMVLDISVEFCRAFSMKRKDEL